MTPRKRKQIVRDLLADRDLDGVVEWSKTARSPLRIIFSLTFDDDEIIRWRAVQAIGQVAALVAGNDLNAVRDFVRRLLWLMNDESGGLSWLSPELIGEILINVPELIEEYGPLLPSFLREEPFERGSHWAIWRVAEEKSDLFSDRVKSLAPSLRDSDPAVRAFAALALLAVDSKTHRDQINPLADDTTEFTIYEPESGQLRSVTVGELVKGALDRADLSEQAA